jgi:riboflavin synthase
MFSGIVEETGTVEQIKTARGSIELVVRLKLCARGSKKGDSLAVNGCCLTLVNLSSRGSYALARFNLLAETWQRTNLQFVKPGSRVNLERSISANGRFGGHFVSGHIDGLGRVHRWEKVGRDHVLDVTVSAEIMRYVVPKGSIAVDGVSLTVAAIRRKSFRVWIIPHTIKVTAFSSLRVGDAVNIEADLIGKYVEKFSTSFLAAD